MHHQYSSRFGLRSELCSEVCVRRAAQQDMVDVFFSAGMPMHGLARFSEYPRVFTYFEVSTVDVVGIYFLSHVLALILLHHPPSVLRENAGGKEAARSSRELPVGNILEEIFLSSCRKIPGTVDVLGILRGQM